MARGSYFRKWRGKEVVLAVGNNMAKALGKFALVAEGHAKKELTKGHGVITGTLRRSIHTAQPGYDWSSDDQPAEVGSAEQGGNMIEAVVDGKRLTIQLGSGLIYALPVHQGHHSFEGYHFLTNGVQKAKADMPGILKEFELK